MRKQAKRYFRRSLCGILSAAMIAASLIAPDMTVYAAPQDAASLTTENEDDKIVDETTIDNEEGEDKDSDLDGDNGNADDKDSENGDESGDSSEDGKDSGEESGDNSDADDKENPDGEDGENPDDDQDELTGDEEDGEDQDLESDDKEEKEKEDDEKLPMSPMATGGDGKLKQGEFDGSWEDIAAAWTLKPGPALSESNFKTNTVDAAHGQSLYIYKESETEIEAAQTVVNAEPGVYQVSLDIGGEYPQDALSLTIQSMAKDENAETYGTVLSTLVDAQKLGKGDGWGTWNKGIKTEAFVALAASGQTGANIKLTIAGTIAKGGAKEQAYIDNVELTKLSYTLDQLKTLLEEANKLKEANYTAESWNVFESAKSAAQKLVTDNSTDADAITLAYANLDAAMNDLVSAGMTFYYYVGELTANDKPIKEVGLCYWGTDNNTNVSTAAEQITTWHGWNNSENKTYKMTPTGYAGWYSIPIRFANDGADAGFSIHAYDGETSTVVEQYDAEKNTKAVYEQLAKSTESVCAVKGDVCYEGEEKATAILRNVTLYMYSEDVIPAIQVEGGSLYVVDETDGTKSEAPGKITNSWGNPTWNMSKTDTDNWYQLSFVAPGKIEFDGVKMCGLLYESDATSKVYKWDSDFVNGEGNGYDFTPVFAGKNYFRKGKFFASMEEADPKPFTLTKLKNLIEQANALQENDYEAAGWANLKTALKDAEDVVGIEEAKEAAAQKPDYEGIEKAYRALRAAIKALVPKTGKPKADIKVERIALDDDFITGADISSYYALKESGVVFKDDDGKPLSDQGFFDYLYEGGMNWARIRVWNDPYNSSGKGYGGGNNDLEKAKIMGKWASDAGMQVLIDFHYSDFWADPGKQKAPKAWANMSVDEKADAVYQFTLESLEELKSAGVNVGMVQVGNETNNGICGETDWEKMADIFNAGSRAVRKFDEKCLVAVHFTNPQNEYGSIASNLDKYNVDYDVFASSYYPFGHGDAANLKRVLSDVAATYKKKVMAAETSWPTTLVDGDGYGTATPPTVPDEYEDQDYGVSVQGQADEMYDLIKAVDEINDDNPESSLGVFYWEPAWISPYYIKDDEGNDIDSLYKKNFDLWEKYGSGWASSYAAEYDPEDAGVWFGGSAMDNSSWFDFDGTPLPTAKIYSLIRTGAEAGLDIASVDSNPVKKIHLGEAIDWDNEKVKAKYNDRTESELPVAWEEDEKELVDIYKAGEYVVHGVVSTERKNYKITLTVQVLRSEENNILVDPGFEDENKSKSWKIEAKGSNNGKDVAFVSTEADDTPHGDKACVHFYSEIDLELTVSQTVAPEAGTYSFGGYIQGGGADSEDVQYAFARVTSEDENGNVTVKSYLTSAFILKGWKNWVNPEITGITVEAGDKVEVGVIMKSTQYKAWGSLDDFYLYGTHTVSMAEGIEHGTVATNVVKADSGERVYVTVTPNQGYHLDTMTLSGASITAENYKKILTSGNGTVAFQAASDGKDNAVVLTYNAETAEAKQDYFTMPNGNVKVSATFKSVFDETTNKIDLKAMESGKYLVQVNAGESESPDGENPIPAQFYTGKAVKPAVQLSYKGYQLTSADYKVEYVDNKNMTEAGSKAKIILTAKGEKFTGEREILFEIKEDTRKDFNAKKLKVVFEAPDKNGRTDKAAKAVYYLGTEKEIEPKISLYNASDNIDNATPINDKLYDVYYQDNKKVGKATLVILPSEKALGDPDGYKEGSITTTFTIAKCPINQQGVTIEMSNKPSYYTGRKAEPAATVTYTYPDQDGVKKTVTLVKGRDYTITYTNNTNASVYEVNGQEQIINSKKVPTVKITGKGSFSGVRTTYTVDEKGKAGTDKITFKIYPRSITNAKITVADLAESNKAQAPKITVRDGEKTVAASQYVIEKIVKTHDEKNEPLDEKDPANTIYSRADNKGTPKVTAAGKYKITIAGKEKSNYTDISGELTFKVVAKKNLIANTKITISGKFYYTGDPIKPSANNDNPNLTVKAGSDTLTEYASRSAAKDENNVERDGYYVTYSNNLSAGTATITVNGTGDYVGTKTATFTIKKRALAKQVSGNAWSTKGAIQTPELSVKVAEVKLDAEWEEGSAGALINSDDGKRGSLAVPYTGYTINPDFKFYSKNKEDASAREMASGDYTVSYKVGKWANGKAPVTVTVKGKGNYSGSVKFDNLFTLTERDFTKLSIKVASATYNGKALKPAVTFYNENGKVVDLKLNTAYSVSYKNNTNSNAAITDKNKQPTVTVKPKGNGWTSKDKSVNKVQNFEIEQAEITKTDVGDVKFQTFLGKALKPKVTIKVNGRKLKEGKDYTLTYSANVKRGGSATVTITGKGNYFTRQPIVKNFVIK